MSELADSATAALLLAAIFSGVPLVVGTIVGFVIGVFQAATQIQEQTLTFVPRLAAVSLALYFLAPWMVDELREVCEEALLKIPSVSL